VTLERFPQRTLRADREIYRIHRFHRLSGNTGWWFSFDETGRFDPVGTGKGSCYFGEQPLGAWVEVYRRQMLLAEAAVTDRWLMSARVGRDLRLADLTSRRALQFGVTASLGANEQYDASQALAAEALGAGFAGIRYLVRHDPAQKLYGIALFGEVGEQPDNDRAEASILDHPIPDELVAQARRRFGYRVVPRP
jgi:RES domain